MWEPTVGIFGQSNGKCHEKGWNDNKAVKLQPKNIESLLFHHLVLVHCFSYKPFKTFSEECFHRNISIKHWSGAKINNIFHPFLYFNILSIMEHVWNWSISANSFWGLEKITQSSSRYDPNWVHINFFYQTYVRVEWTWKNFAYQELL